MKIKDQIMALNDGKRSVREIAEIVYGAPATKAQCAHVRVVVRQRKGNAQSNHDKAYRATPRGKELNALYKRRAYWRAQIQDSPPPAVKKFLEGINA